MDRELIFYKWIGSLLPKVPHSTGIINRIVKPIYLRKNRGQVHSDVFDFKMRLDPSEAVDRALLFYPHLYDFREIEFLKSNLYKGDCFLDVGANVGFYSLVASKIVSENGNVLAIEADLYNYSKLKYNIELNSFSNIRPINLGVSDKIEVLKLGINNTGNRGGNSFLFSNAETGSMVHCDTLSNIILQNGIQSIKGMKIDIEGFEYRVLKKFFSDTNESLYPGFIIVEFFPQHIQAQGGDTISLLKDVGYHIHSRSGYNYIMIK